MLNSGDQLPDITLTNQSNESVNLRSSIGAPLVVYFYPKNFTPGCTIEACAFRDNYNRLLELDAKVIGISADSPDSHARFSQKYRLKYTLLSDPERTAEKAFGVKRNLFGVLAGRETFVFDTKGVLVKRISSAINPIKHVDESILALEKLMQQREE